MLQPSVMGEVGGFDAKTATILLHELMIADR